MHALAPTTPCSPRRQVHVKERAVLRALPPPLQLEAAKQLRLQLLLGSEIAPVLPSSALARLTLEMSEVVVPAGELLLLEGDVCSTSIFNVHLTCATCGLMVCGDCYTARRAGTRYRPHQASAV